MVKQWKEVELGDISTMEFGKTPKKSKNNNIYLEPELVVIARGVEDIGKVKISLPKSQITNSFIILKFNEDIADKKYYYYYLQARNLRSIGSDSKKPRITIKDLKKVKVKMPPLEEQQRISRILSTFDNKIKRNNKISKILEKAVQAIYKHWFIDFEFPNENDKAYKSDGGEFEDTKWGLVPKGWHVGKLTEIIDVVHNSKGKLYPKDTVFVTVKGMIGKVNINTVPMAVNQSCFALIGKENIGQYFVYILMKNCNKKLIKKSYGTVFHTIDIETFDSLNILIPSKSVIGKFEITVTPLFAKMRQLSVTNNALSKLRNRLLPKLISGDMRVV